MLAKLEKRAGPGRPEINPLFKKIPVGYRLPRWLVYWMRQQDVAGAVLIEQALIGAHNLKRPCVDTKELF